MKIVSIEVLVAVPDAAIPTFNHAIHSLVSAGGWKVLGTHQEVTAYQTLETPISLDPDVKP